MANSREAQFQWDISKDMIARGLKAGTAGGYVRNWKYVSELQLPHYRLTKREEERLRLEMAGEDGGRTSASYVRSGELHDPEKLHFANGIADLIERDEAGMAQLRNHSEDQVMHGLFLEKVNDAVLGAFSDLKKLSMPLLEDKETGRKFGLLILKLLAGRSWLLC
ncbi:hypothetical protein [Halomonas piscis]|uniref:hypothetical protein n=1 Tax=Halomonas piscis TaxID=3031727 RepID=UPI0028991210|nr:hypothetical protein [Halomonas piscis]